MYKKYYAAQFPDRRASDFVFKAAGVREFICGPYTFTAFEYIRKKFTKQEKIELVMFERKHITIPNQDNLNEKHNADWMQGGEEVNFQLPIAFSHLFPLDS